jgi:hypothetical protein
MNLNHPGSRLCELDTYECRTNYLLQFFGLVLDSCGRRNNFLRMKWKAFKEEMEACILTSLVQKDCM